MSSLDLLLEAFQEVNAVHSEVIDLVSESVSDGQHSDVLLEGHSDESNVQIVTHAEVVDLLSDTISGDSSSGSADSTESVLGSVDYGANAEDVLAIQLMLESGRGVFGHTGCILERRISLLQSAGLGIFLSDGAVITNGMCITEYDGDVITTQQFDSLPEEDQLYGMRVNDVLVNGLQVPLQGRGLGSFFNSAVAGRCYSFVRPVVLQNRIFFMCDVCDQYPLIGPLELYFTAGISWWRLYRRHMLHLQAANDHA